MMQVASAGAGVVAVTVVMVVDSRGVGARMADPTATVVSLSASDSSHQLHIAKKVTVGVS